MSSISNVSADKAKLYSQHNLDDRHRASIDGHTLPELLLSDLRLYRHRLIAFAQNNIESVEDGEVVRRKVGVTAKARLPLTGVLTGRLTLVRCLTKPSLL